jgi:hypothetical protein
MVFTHPVAASTAVIVQVCVTGALVKFVTKVDPFKVLIAGVLFHVYE